MVDQTQDAPAVAAPWHKTPGDGPEPQAAGQVLRPGFGGRSNKARRRDDGRLSAPRARRRAVAALLPVDPFRPAARPSAAASRLAEAIVDLDAAIDALRGRVQAMGHTTRSGDLSKRALRLVKLNEQRAALLAALKDAR